MWSAGIALRLRPAKCRIPEKRRSNTEDTVVDKQRDFIWLWRGVGGGVSCYVSIHIMVRYCRDRYRKGCHCQCGENICIFCSLLVFVELDMCLSILAAAVIE